LFDRVGKIAQSFAAVAAFEQAILPTLRLVAGTDQ
jgi:hypothetical protein